jgi:hypothetical protein
VPRRLVRAPTSAPAEVIAFACKTLRGSYVALPEMVAMEGAIVMNDRPSFLGRFSLKQALLVFDSGSRCLMMRKPWHEAKNVRLAALFRSVLPVHELPFFPATGSPRCARRLRGAGLEEAPDKEGCEYEERRVQPRRVIPCDR